jgi:hypothetical protein
LLATVASLEVVAVIGRNGKQIRPQEIAFQSKVS